MKQIFCVVILVTTFVNAQTGAVLIENLNASTVSWTVPAGITEIIVECWGSGGNGSTAEGGGGGAYSRSTISVVPAQTYYLSVGNSTAAAWFGTTNNINSALVLARGGANASSFWHGAGGSATTGIGQTKYNGGSGSTVIDFRKNGGNSGGIVGNGRPRDQFSGAPPGQGEGGREIGNTNGTQPGGGGAKGTTPGTGARGVVRVSSTYQNGLGTPTTINTINGTSADISAKVFDFPFGGFSGTAGFISTTAPPAYVVCNYSTSAYTNGSSPLSKAYIIIHSLFNGSFLWDEGIGAFTNGALKIFVDNATVGGVPVPPSGVVSLPISSATDGFTYLHSTYNPIGQTKALAIDLGSFNANQSKAITFTLVSEKIETDALGSSFSIPFPTLTVHGLGFDYGDAPTPYPPVKHAASTNPPLWLGSNRPDYELQANFSGNPNATADNAHTFSGNSSGYEDEDLVFPNTYSSVNPNLEYTVTIPYTSFTNGTISVWIDWNQDGVFDVSERKTAAVSSGTGTRAFTYNLGVNSFKTIPGSTSTTTYVARVRIGSNASEVSSPNADAVDGEVEDLTFTISSSGPDVAFYQDINVGFQNRVLTGNLATNDVNTTGFTYQNAIGIPGNPNANLPNITSNGSYTFTSNVPGVYQFMVPVCEALPAIACYPIRLTITLLDDNATINPPIANTDVALTFQNTPIIFEVIENDKAGSSLSSISTLTLPPTIITPATSGTSTVVGNHIQYSPSPSFSGTDSILYQVCDNQSPSNCITSWYYIDVLATGSSNRLLGSDDFSITRPSTPVTGNILINDRELSTANSINLVVTPQTLNTTDYSFSLQSNGNYVFTAQPGFSGTVNFIYQICNQDATPLCANATLYILVEESSLIRIFPTVLLEGPIISGTTNMTTFLSAGGASSILATYALQQPYNRAPWNYAGGESVNNQFFDTHAGIVDWILIEIRDQNNNTNIIQRRSGLLLSNGNIIDTDGQPGLTLEGLSPGNYYIAVRHRNHLGIMTAAPIFLDLDPTLNQIDFSSSTTILFGNNAVQAINPNVQALHMGNAFVNSLLNFTGSNNDKAAIGLEVNSSVTPSNSVPGYHVEDIDLNGTVTFTGTNNDKSKLGIKLNTAVSVSTTITEQLP